MYPNPSSLGTGSTDWVIELKAVKNITRSKYVKLDQFIGVWKYHLFTEFLSHRALLTTYIHTTFPHWLHIVSFQSCRTISTLCFVREMLQIALFFNVLAKKCGSVMRRDLILFQNSSLAWNEIFIYCVLIALRYSDLQHFFISLFCNLGFCSKIFSPLLLLPFSDWDWEVFCNALLLNTPILLYC